MTKEDFKERDLLFCELLFELGSVSQASEQLGITYRQGRKIAERNRDTILDMTQTELASMAFKAVKTVKDVMTDDDIIKGDTKLKAAESVLDRIGASKKSVPEVSVNIESPVILLPAKATLPDNILEIQNGD